MVLGVGIGELHGQAFRIAHMGHVNAPMILGTLGVVEVALSALDIPHGKGGTTAAIEWRHWGLNIGFVHQVALLSGGDYRDIEHLAAADG